MRGNPSHCVRTTKSIRGLPPRVRGNRDHHLVCRRLVGPTPARAGQPRSARPARHAERRAYPRACGATRARCRCSLSPWAYPRACGATLGTRLRRNTDTRPTPARAGQPQSRAAPGGTRGGLPPRVRGNHSKKSTELLDEAYPRACGATSTTRAFRTRKAYPRACGATQPAPVCSNRCSGLPPRVRGNRRPRRHVARVTGLPPRVRGNPRVRLGRWHVRGGPTPARAGQPM